MTRAQRILVLTISLLASWSVVHATDAQAVSPAQDPDTMQKPQGKAAAPAQEGLKRRDLKGQAMSQPAQPEGLTPEQKKMYEDIQQQLQQIRENKAKSDAALEELMKGEGK
ncbi:MAG: hypothetical protein ACKOCD_03065 [Nitrospiraceae bacterium]